MEVYSGGQEGKGQPQRRKGNAYIDRRRITYLHISKFQTYNLRHRVDHPTTFRERVNGALKGRSAGLGPKLGFSKLTQIRVIDGMQEGCCKEEHGSCHGGGVKDRGTAPERYSEVSAYIGKVLA